MSKGSVIVLCPNPAIEVTYFCKQVALGEQIDADIRIVAGGKGTNVASVLAKLGASPVLLTCLGGKLGELYQSQVLQIGIEHDFVSHEAELRISTVIYESARQEPTIIRTNGQPISAESEIRFIRLVKRYIASGRFVCLSGSLPNGFSTGFVEHVSKAVRAGRGHVLLDVVGAPLISGLAARPLLVKINYREAANTFGSGSQTKFQLKELLTMMRDQGAQNSIITLGRNGWIASIEGSFLRCTIDANPQGFDIGAGDAMLAGIAKGLADGLPWRETLTAATRIAAASTYCPSSGEIVLDVLDNLPPCPIESV